MLESVARRGQRNATNSGHMEIQTVALGRAATLARSMDCGQDSNSVVKGRKTKAPRLRDIDFVIGDPDEKNRRP
jgi:hypothetical protein